MSNIKKPILCKNCDSDFYTPVACLIHAMKHHSEVVTKDAVIDVLKTQIVQIIYPFVMLLVGVLHLVKWFCYPFWWIHEWLKYGL